MLEESLLWEHAGRVLDGDMTEEASDVTRSLGTPLGHVEPVLYTEYLELVRTNTDMV